MHLDETYDLGSVGKWLNTHSSFGPPLEYKVSDKGELLVRGGSGFAGYYKEEKTEVNKDYKGWFRTGDMMKVTNQNELVYIDRLEDIRPLSIGESFAPQFIENRLRFSTFIRDAITILDGNKLSVAALININAATVGPWAEHRKIRYTTFTDLSQNSKVRELIKIEIEKINHFLPEKLKIKFFINLPKELDPDEDELTQTQKLRRCFLEQKYATFISAISKGETEFKAEVPIKYRDGRNSVLSTTVYINDLIQE
jgi:long-chain acyl-CoA synthetase